MKNALILHGTDNNHTGNWFPWIKHEFEKEGWKVWVPDLPNSHFPNVKRYNEFIFSNKDFEFNGETVIVGHSSGSVEILGLLQKLPDGVKINKAILIGTFEPEPEASDWKQMKGLFKEPFDFEKIKIKADKFIVLHSDNDPYCSLQGAKNIAAKLGAEFILKPGQGHFNLEFGPQYKQFPLILRLI